MTATVDNIPAIPAFLSSIYHRVSHRQRLPHTHLQRHLHILGPNNIRLANPLDPPFLDTSSPPSNPLSIDLAQFAHLYPIARSNVYRLWSRVRVG